MRNTAGGPPNGRCKNCGRGAVSLRADYCSQRCQSKDRKQPTPEAMMKKHGVMPDHVLARREPEREVEQ